jgi:hypothetical protein
VTNLIGIASNITYLKMPEKSSILADVKSKQYLLICKSGLAVPSFEMSAEQINDSMMRQFKHHVEQFKLPAHFSGLPKERFFRTANHLIILIIHQILDLKLFGEMAILTTVTIIWMKVRNMNLIWQKAVLELYKKSYQH